MDVLNWAPEPSLPPVAEFTSFTMTYAWPEIIRWFLFAAGVLVVVAVIRRLSGR